MYLKSLELHGFKSFPNRTVLTFERGATVIVGPNGSGKSNISDAMRWVLGELSSRNIRGTKMEDVIFGGTDDRRPMGFAEVTVVFDNCEPNRLDSPYDEVSVTRRYYRTGDSEYLINKEPKRLKDIYELFMNTGVGREGYSIIGQGKIAEIVSKKSDERRSIFEEAAGISKYRHRKEESEKKLKATFDNMERVKDTLIEKENLVNMLEKDAEKARRGLEVYEEKKRADVSLWLYDSEKILHDIEEAENAYHLSKHELEIVVAQLEDLDKQNDSLYEKSQSGKLQSDELLEKVRLVTERIHLLDNNLKVAENNYAHSDEMISACRERLDEIAKNRAVQEKNKQEFEADIRACEEKMQEILTKRQSFLDEQSELTVWVETTKKKLDEALDELTVEENTAADLRARLNMLKDSKIDDTSKSEDMEEEIRKYEEEGAALKAEAERCEAATADFKEKIDEKTAVITKAQQDVEALIAERDDVIRSIGQKQVEHDTLLQKAEAFQRMLDHFEGYQDSIRFVMREYAAGNISAGKIYGPLSSLLTVDKQYITAIDIALGASLQNIVVEKEATAKACMRALKETNSGRATFYPIETMHPSAESEDVKNATRLPGFVGRADTLVGCKDEFRGIIQYLLMRTCVFTDLDSASNAARQLRYKVKLVTLDGQVINAGGSYTGGSTKKESGTLTRASEIENLKKQAANLERLMAQENETKDEIERDIAAAKDSEKDAEQEKELLLALSRGQFAALDTANADYHANRNLLEKLRNDYDVLMGRQSSADENISRLSAELKAAEERAEALKDYRKKTTAELGVKDERRDECGGIASNLTISATEARKDMESYDAQIRSVEERMAELDAEKQTQNNRIAELSNKQAGISELRETTREETERLEAELKELEEARREIDSGTDEFDRELNNLRQKAKEKNDSRDVLNEASIRNETKLSQLKEKQEKLSSQLWDDYEITYDDAVALQYPPVTDENREEIGKVQASCRAKMRSIGNFDPESIEKYADAKTAYDTLNVQYKDLSASYDDLNQIIARLEVEMRESFVGSFEAINKNFGITFRELFGGGNAELSLTEPEDVLTSGIEIKAAPPGKIIKSMSLLSGGEQSFVAIALLFAILKVNPTPFCILDEIEAALDEVNVFRFGEYIKKFDDGTQFILITHRRGTMEVGDRLYGVTMPQRGISQAIELNVNEIEGKQKELLDGVL